MRRPFEKLVLVVAVFTGCSSFGSSATNPATSPDAGDAPTSDGGGVDVDPDVGVAPGTDASPDGASPLSVIATFNAIDAIGSVIGVAADATHIAWLYHDENGASQLGVIGQNDASGKASVSALDSDATSISANGDTIFVAGEGGSTATIVRVRSDGNPAQIFNQDDGFWYPNAIFAAGDGLYVAVASQPTGDGIYRLPYANAVPPAPVALFSDSFGSTEDLVVAAGISFFRTAGSGIYAVATTGEPTDFCTYAGECTQGAAAITTDGTTIYWSDESSIVVYGCAASASCTTNKTKFATVSSIPEATIALAWSGTSLVIGTLPGGDDRMAKIYACAPGAGACAQSPVPLVREQGLAGRIFATASAIYWIADDGATTDAGVVHAYRVMRLTR